MDGGVFANNPALVGVLEAQTWFAVEYNDLAVLSIGTDSQTFKDARTWAKWGIWYWINHRNKRIIDLFMQGQSQQVDATIRLLKRFNAGLDYLRIDTEMDEASYVKLDETSPEKLQGLSEKAAAEFQKTSKRALELLAPPP